MQHTSEGQREMKSWKEIIISPNKTIKQALEIIDHGALQLALVADENFKLIGTLSDGDIRRALIKGSALDQSIETIINRTPNTVTLDTPKTELRKLMRDKDISKIPIIDERGILIGLHVEDQMNSSIWEDRFVVIMCGGLGSRLGDLTKEIPKPLLKVGQKPILETIVENFANTGCKKIYLSVNYRSEMIKNHFLNGEKWGISIEYIEENIKMGTAGSLSLLKIQPQKPFIVMNGDILTKINFDELLTFHDDKKASATVCVREFDFQVPYGVVRIDQNYDVLEIEEKPIHKFFVSAGVYVLNPEVLPLINHNEYMDMPQLFKSMIDKKKALSSFPIREYWLDIGKTGDYEKANHDYGIVFK